MKGYDTIITAHQLRGDPNPDGRKNHGVRWTSEHYSELKNLWFCTNKPFREVCDAMGRSYSSIVAKLTEQGFMKYDSVTGEYYGNRNSTSNQSNQPKESIMSANIETKTFIGGVDAASMDDTQVFRQIAKLEGEIDKLKAIRAKSTKLSAAIKALEKDVTELVAYVDGR